MVDVYQFPRIYPDLQRLRPEAPGQALQQGEFGGSQNIVTWQGSERWALEMTFNDLVGDNRADMQAFVTKLRVSRDVFLVVNHSAPQRGALSGTPMVNSAPAGATEMEIGNLGSVSSWMRDGDFFSVNSELKMCTSDVAAATTAIIPFWPPLRQTANSGTLVVVSSPAGAFRMIRATDFTTTPPGYQTSFVMSAIERVNSSAVSELLS